jgi:hypothetical protein
MAFTYTQLKQAIQDYTENDETTFVGNLDVFIRLAEERILKSVQLNLFQKNVSGTMTSGVQYLNCPTDFLAPMSLSFTNSDGDEVFLLFKDLDYVQTYTPDPATTGAPIYYAQFDVDNFLLGPTPNASYTTVLHYLYRPTSLTNLPFGVNTTWLSENAEIALLYGSLIEAYVFMKGEQDVLAAYNARFGEALSRLKNFGEALEVSDEYRTGQIRRPKS